MRRNPPLAVLVNPPREMSVTTRRKRSMDIRLVEEGIISDDVHDIRYAHTDDGTNYQHRFGPDVQAVAATWGSRRVVILVGPDHLWQDFE